MVPGHCWSFFQGLDIHYGTTCPSLPALTEVTQGERVLPGVVNMEAEEPTTDKSKVLTKFFSLVLLPFLEEFSCLSYLNHFKPRKEQRLRNNSGKTGELMLCVFLFWDQARAHLQRNFLRLPRDGPLGPPPCGRG